MKSCCLYSPPRMRINYCCETEVGDGLRMLTLAWLLGELVVVSL